MTAPDEWLNELQDATDALLMGHVAVGEPEAVRLLIARYERPLLRLLHRATGSSASVDDLFQETWIRVVRSATSYDPRQPFPAWLFAIAWNRVRDHWSRQKPRTDDAADLTLLTAPGASAEEQMVRKSEAEQMRRAVASLPPALAEALLLRYFEACPNAKSRSGSASRKEPSRAACTMDSKNSPPSGTGAFHERTAMPGSRGRPPGLPRARHANARRSPPAPERLPALQADAGQRPRPGCPRIRRRRHHRRPAASKPSTPPPASCAPPAAAAPSRSRSWPPSPPS